MLRDTPGIWTLYGQGDCLLALSVSGDARQHDFVLLESL